MKLTIEEARTLSDVKLYKALDPLNDRAKAGERISHAEKYKPLEENMGFITSLIAGEVSKNEIIDLSSEWVAYFKQPNRVHLFDKNYHVIKNLVDRMLASAEL